MENLLNRIKSKFDKYINKKELLFTSISLGCATKADSNESIDEVVKLAESNMYKQKLLQNKSTHSSIISSMKSALLEKSKETEEHALRLISLSLKIGKSLNLSNAQINDLELLSTLHDIGKIGINESILNKPVFLTEEERIIIQKHPEIGYRIAKSSPELTSIAEFILYHHERFDGNGYPSGLKKEEIPLLSRIIAVVDAYDAMTQDRLYRSAMSEEEAIEEIKNNSGSQFDPTIVEIFLKLLEDFRSIK